MLTPSLRLFSQVSSLLWFSPTSDKPLGSLRLQDLNRPYLDSGICQTSQVCRYYLVRSPRSLTPTEPTAFSLIDCRITACDPEDGIGFRSIYLTGLYCFTLSHCGSRTPLPTLKPHLAALAPRLCTGCLLGFTGLGLSPNCIICTELAHPLLLLYLKVIRLSILLSYQNLERRHNKWSLLTPKKQVLQKR